MIAGNLALLYKQFAVFAWTVTFDNIAGLGLAARDAVMRKGSRFNAITLVYYSIRKVRTVSPPKEYSTRIAENQSLDSPRYV